MVVVDGGSLSGPEKLLPHLDISANNYHDVHGSGCVMEVYRPSNSRCPGFLSVCYFDCLLLSYNLVLSVTLWYAVFTRCMIRINFVGVGLTNERVNATNTTK